MSRRELERMAAELDAIGRDVFRIRALSRTQPHVFAEEKDALSRRCEALARMLRQMSGGSPVPNCEIAQNGKLTPVLDCQGPAHRDTRLDGIAGRVCFPAKLAR